MRTQTVFFLNYLLKEIKHCFRNATFLAHDCAICEHVSSLNRLIDRHGLSVDDCSIGAPIHVHVPEWFGFHTRGPIFLLLLPGFLCHFSRCRR